MKKIIIAIIAIAFIAIACNKQAQNDNTTTTSASTKKTRHPILDIRLTVYKGKRSTNDTTTGDPCDGRSICIVIGKGDKIINGGVFPTTSLDIPNHEKYIFHLIYNGTNFIYRVYQNEITTHVYNNIFCGNCFIMDEDFSFPKFVCDYFDMESIILHKGNYVVTSNTNFTEFVF